MDFRVLGPLEVNVPTGPLPLGSGRRLRTLLAMFLAQPNRVLSSDALIESLWSDNPPPSAATALRVHLTRLRSRLEPDRARAAPSDRLVTEAAGYRLRVERDELDSLRFEQLVQFARRAESRSVAAGAYAEADSLWRGPAFADLDDIDLVRVEVVRLQELRASALEESFDIRLALGEHAALVVVIQQALDDYPLRERLAGQLMTALYRAGRQTEALRVYAGLRERLGEELGIEPDVELSRLETAIVRHEPELDLTDTGTRTEYAPTSRFGAPAHTAGVLVGGPELSAVAKMSSGLEIDVAADEVVFAFVSASEAARCAAELLRGDRRAAIGMSVGDWPSSNRGGVDPTVEEARTLRRAAANGRVLASEAAALMAGVQAELHFDSPVRVSFDTGTTALVAAGQLPQSREPLVPLPGLLVDEEQFQFAGRPAELELFDRLYGSVEDGAFNVVLVSGEPGIGKTRLAAEAARLAHARDWTVLYGRCDERVRTPFQPFVDTLESFAGFTPDESLASRLGQYAGELTRLLPSLSTRIAGLDPPLQSDPETERYQMFQAVADWLRTSARGRPIMLIVDDLQWAEQPTLLLLRHLVRTPDLVRLLLVATYRDTKPERGAALDEMLADLSRARRVDRCALEGLDVGAVHELLTGDAGMAASDATEQLAALIHGETAGNPFFVHELIRPLAETGAADYSGERAIRPVPASVRDVVAQRLGRLPPEVDDLLTNAAVIGGDFDLALLRAVSDADEDETLYLLDTAIQARLVQETDFDEYRFVHALVQSALYEPLTEARRVRLHRRVGEALEVLCDGHPERRLPELAHHFLESARAGVSEKAVSYATSASDAALNGLAFEDAANLCRRGLVALEYARENGAGVARTDEYELLLRLGRAELRSGQPGARETLLRAFGIARDLDDRSRLAQAVLAINRGFFARIGRTDRELVETLEYAIEAQPPDDSRVLAELLATLASELVWTEDGERRFQLSSDALAMARRVGDQRTLANVLLLRNFTIHSTDTLAERVAECDELLAIAEALRDPAVIFQAAFNRSGTSMEAGNIDAANAMVELAEQRAGQLNQPSLLFHMSMMRTSRRILEGSLDDAEHDAYATFELGQLANQGGEALIFFTELLLEIRRWQGRLAEMLPEFGSLAGLPGIDFGYTLVRYLYDAGEEAQAIALYHGIMREQPLPPRRDLVAGATLCNLAYLAARAGDAQHGPRIYDELVPLAASFFNTTVAKPVSEHFLGVLAASMRDVATAEAHFAAAIAAQEHVRAPLFVAETKAEWARLLAGPGGDPRRAEILVGEVREAASTHAAGFLRRSISQLTARPPKGTDPGPA